MSAQLTTVFMESPVPEEDIKKEDVILDTSEKDQLFAEAFLRALTREELVEFIAMLELSM